MNAWVSQALACLDQGQDVVLISVASVRGSAPRDAGTKMLVSADEQWLTIGGGQLEWQAIHQARAYLQKKFSKPRRWVTEMPLAASLGQCCGGLVHLLFEHLLESDRAWLKDAHDRLQRLESFERQLAVAPVDADAWVQLQAPGAASNPANRFVANRLLQDSPEHGCLVFTEALRPAEQNIVVFGAGHVGKALVHILGTLPCRVAWVDSRANMFPAKLPPNVVAEPTDVPEAVIDEAPAGSYYLVITHDHDLDQRLCEYLLRRKDASYIGLIGSRAKWHRFRQRFEARGIPAENYERISCPIGEPGIRGKEPAMIALAVAAQLMKMRNRQPAHD